MIILKRLKKDKNQAIFCPLPVQWLQLCSNKGIVARENILLELAAELWWEVISHIPCCLLQGTMTIKGQEKLLKPLYESKPKIIVITTLLISRWKKIVHTAWLEKAHWIRERTNQASKRSGDHSLREEFVCLLPSTGLAHSQLGDRFHTIQNSSCCLFSELIYLGWKGRWASLYSFWCTVISLRIWNFSQSILSTDSTISNSRPYFTYLPDSANADNYVRSYLNFCSITIWNENTMLV